jgi:hypothetical protein
MIAATNIVELPMQCSYQQSRTTVSGGPVFKIGSLAEWQITALKKIARLESLPENWDSYGSAPPTSRVCGVASDIIRKVPFDNAPVPQIIAVSGGGIHIAWSKGARELDIEICADGTLEFLRSVDGEPLDEGERISGAIFADVERYTSWLNAG